jgi:hypothetical protein
MKAVLFAGHGGPEVLRLGDVPDPGRPRRRGCADSGLSALRGRLRAHPSASRYGNLIKNCAPHSPTRVNEVQICKVFG